MNELFTLPYVGMAFTHAMTLLGVCSVRLYVIFYIFPPTADGVLQGTVRNGVVLLFSTFVAYGQTDAFAASLAGVTMVEVVLREAVIGVLLGFSASTVFWVAEGAGVYIDDLTGYNNAQVTNPLRDEESTPTGTLMMQLATVSFWVLGGMTFLLGAVYESYRWWPIASSTPVATNVLESFVLRQTDSLMQMIAKLAAPILFVLVLIDLAFGFAEKGAQKLDLGNMSQPVKGLVTVLMLALFAGVFVEQVKDQLTLKSFTTELQALAKAMRR